MTSSENRFWRYRVPVFAGENSTNVAESLTLVGARAVMQLRLIQDPRFELFASLYAGYMRLPKGVTLTSPNVIDLIRARFTSLARAISRKGDHILADLFIKMGDLKGVSVFNDDVRTVMRHSRSMIPDLRMEPSVRIKHSFSEFFTAHDHCSSCLPAPHSVHHNMWNRYKQRLRGGLSSAGYTWLPLITHLQLSHYALVVGNGNGGLADLLITCFGVEIIGLDLERDMPRDSATLLNYLPLGLSLENRSSFIQTDWSINSSGDWTDSQVRDKVLAGLPGLSTVFIDATDVPLSMISRACGSTMAHSLVSNCYARLIGPADEIIEAVQHLKNTYEIRMWVYTMSQIDTEVIVEVSRAQLGIHRCHNAPALVDKHLTPSMHEVIPDRRGELLEAATCMSISWNGETLTEAYGVMRNLCVSLLNKTRNRQLIYQKRYGLILGYSVLYALHCDNPQVQIQEWISEELIETDIFQIHTREAMISHLIRYVARLSSYRDTSPLFFS
jgi:hypothetical protein